MITCNYCGQENDDAQASCGGCGTALQAAAATEPEPPVIADYPPPPPPRLNGGIATLILLAYLASQVVSAVGIGVVVGLSSGARHVSTRDQFDRLLPPMIIVVMIIGGIVTVGLSALLVREELKDTSPTGAAWVRGSWAAVMKGLVLGVVLGGCLALLSFAAHTHEPRNDPGPMTRMMMTPGFAQIAGLTAAVLLAPPTEELLFRGVVYGGFRKSLGAFPAAALTTTIFVLLHFSEFIHSPGAVVSITGLALTALWCRLRFGAIGPAIAVHFGYNGMISLGMICSMWRDSLY